MKLNEVFLSAAQYARLRGVEATYVHQLHRTGRLVVDEHGRVAVRASDALIASTRQRRPHRGRAAAQPNHPWTTPATDPRCDDPLDLHREVATILYTAALALAPRVAPETDVAACRSFIAQELARAARKVTDLALRHISSITADTTPGAQAELPTDSPSTTTQTEHHDEQDDHV